MRTLCKKALALCVVFALALTCFVGTLSVSAADPYDATLSVADVEVDFGATTATAVLHIAVAAPGINEAIINIDSTIGTIDAEPILNETTLVVDGGGDAYVDVVGDDFSKLFLSARRDPAVTELNGILTADITVEFTLNEGVKPGTYPINIVTEGVKAADKNETVVNLVYATVGNFVVTCDHANATEEVTKEATCTETGVKTITCACGYTTTEEIPVIPHDYEAVVTEPTCEAAGFTTYTCSVCGDSYTGDETEALGHSYTYESNDDGTHKAICANESIDASFNEDCADEDANGVCDKCEYVFPVEEPECEHENVATATYVSSIVATEEDAGEITLICADCGKEYTETVYYDTNSVLGSAIIKCDATTILGIRTNYSRYTNRGAERGIMVYTKHYANGAADTVGYYDGVDEYVSGNYVVWEIPVSYNQFTSVFDCTFITYCDGQWVSGQTKNYSIKDSAMSFVATGTTGEKYGCANLLRAGAEAQLAFDYATDDLADADLVGDYAAYVVSTKPSVQKIVGTNFNQNPSGWQASGYVGFATPALLLDDSVTAVLKINPDYAGGKDALTDLKLKYSYTAEDGSPVEGTLTDYIWNSSNRAEFNLQVTAPNMRTIISIEAYNGDTPISDVAVYSIEGVFGHYYASYESLIDAMMNYSDVIAQYF